jgi:P-type Ca2+ transporter type 2C
VQDSIKADWRKTATLEFNRIRKTMSVLCRSREGRNKLFVKGAPDFLLERCNKVLAPTVCLHYKIYVVSII